jgi:thymidylate synthase
MNNLDEQLKELYTKILKKERIKTNRTNIGTKSIFGYQMRFNMNDGFPLTTLRKIHKKSLVHELLWFLSSYDDEYKIYGNTNIYYLLKNGVTFWTDWCYEKYRKEILSKYLDNDLKDDKHVKKLKLITQKEFENKIIEDKDFALKYGNLGPVYGKQWVDWGGYYEFVEKTNQIKSMKSDSILIDKMGWQKIYMKGINQIDNVIDLLINEPDSRRIIVNAWNVGELEDMALAPCHAFFQFYSEVIELEDRINILLKNISIDDINNYNNNISFEDIKKDIRKIDKNLTHFNIPERRLSLQMYQRSVDSYLGLPYNIASYALLLHLVAQIVNMIPEELVWTGGDVHLYSNSINATQELLKRDIKELPKLNLNQNIMNLYDFRYSDINIINYNPHENIHVDVAV